MTSKQQPDVAARGGPAASPSRRFNDLPHEQRLIASAVIIETQINQIRLDQEKAKAAHRKFMNETNAHIRNLEQSLAARLAEIDQLAVTR